MRHDEGSPDLDAQYSDRGEAGRHRYFVFPYVMPEKSWGPSVSIDFETTLCCHISNFRVILSQFEHISFASMPSRIQECMKKQQIANFMGIFPEINRFGYSFYISILTN